MKYFYYLLLFLMATLFSCSSDLEDSNFSKEEIDHQKPYLEFHPVHWRKDFSDLRSGPGSTLSEPIVYKDLLIMNKHRYGLVAVNRHTGDLVWTKDRALIGEQAGFLAWDSFGMEIIDQILVCFPSNDSFGLDPETGEILWHIEYPQNDGTHSRRIFKNSFYKFSKDEINHFTLVKTDIKTGHSINILTWPTGVEPRIDDQSVMLEYQGDDFISLTWDGAIRLFNLRSKKVEWSYPYYTKNTAYNKIFSYKDNLIFTNMSFNNASISSISVHDGSVNWRHKLDYIHLYSQIQYEDNLLYGGVQGYILKLNLENGTTQYYKNFGAVFTKLHIRDGMMYDAGFTHLEDNPFIKIGSKIAVIDPKTMTLSKTILPHCDKNTTVDKEECGVPVFDMDYSYLGNRMAFSKDKKFIYATGEKSELYCLRVCDTTVEDRGN